MKGEKTVVASILIIILRLIFTFFYFSPLFALSFGGELERCIFVITFFSNLPFTACKAGQVNTALVYINAWSWILIIALILCSMARLIKKSELLLKLNLIGNLQVY